MLSLHETIKSMFEVSLSLFFIFFTDYEAPVIICPVNQSINADPSQSFATVFWIGPEATDNSKERPTVTCSVEPGNKFKMDQTDVLCEARDSSGNVAECTFTVDVKGVICYSLHRYIYVRETRWLV